MAVGELFLGAFLHTLFRKLADGATMALASREKIVTHFKKLSQSSSLVLAVLEDAEEKQLTDKAVKEWLELLRDWAYDLDDLLDEITTRARIQDSKGIQHHKISRVWQFIPTCSNYMPTSLVTTHRMMSRIKDITNRLDNIIKQKGVLKLMEKREDASKRALVVRRQTDSFVYESHVYGRDDDKEAITNLLLQDYPSNENFSVIPIVGMGGIGKTTLAQIVYNDENVVQNFPVRAWVCVSEVLDVFKITKTILENLNSVVESSNQSKDLNVLQLDLQNKLSKSKFLIVLDDFWSESKKKWDLLTKPFQSGLPGSRIIVTTRNELVASVVGSPRTAYHMMLLNPEDCLSLLARHAERSIGEDSDLRDVGQRLVKKCRGLPLAAKTLGGILQSKTSKEEWEDVLNRMMLEFSEENNIAQVLKLSYYHLPSHLKPLFTYCSIFPNGYEFNKRELVLLWMGEGFLENTSGRKTKEDLGLEYFDELLSRSFFQHVSGSNLNFVMHHLIYDLAQSVAGEIYYHLDDKMDINVEYCFPEKARHATFLQHEYEIFAKFKGFYLAQGLRTFLPMPVQNSLVSPPFYLSNSILFELVPRLSSLRVLSLRGYSVTDLPSSIGYLILLRYLNLSGTSIVTLPDSLGDLYNLETLCLSNCRFISKLPWTLGNLSNLRHLDISNTDLLKDMPVEIGQLRSLQTLSKIVVSNAGGLGLRGLKNLELLRGALTIMELQNVTDLDEVSDANLRSKDKLDELQLTWGSGICSNSNVVNQEDVIDLLQPHDNLRNLRIEFFRGGKFPTWIGNPSFNEMTNVSLVNCTACTTLPPFGQLPALKHLVVEGMPKVKFIGVKFYGRGNTMPFQKLETLRFSNMPELEQWSTFSDNDHQINFPNLHQLTMFKCNNLTDVSPISCPVLYDLDIEECRLVLLESFRDLVLLTHLKVKSISGLNSLPMGLLNSLSALEALECRNCNELVSLWPNGVLENNLISLRRLEISDCSQLSSLGEGEYQIPSNLEVFVLVGCTNLKSLPNDLSIIRSLRDLMIQNCPELVAFPENGIPPMLKRLEIHSCNSLESLPSIASQIERLEIKDCPSLKAWNTVEFPVALRKLSIKNCTQLDPVRDSMVPIGREMSLEDLSLCNWLNSRHLLDRLLNFSNLVELYISSCYELRHFPEEALPPYLRSLSIADCKNLTSLPVKIRTMESMRSLEIGSCHSLDNFPNFNFPQNLSSLRIWDSKEFKPLSQWGLHRLATLREFSICDGFSEVELLGKDDSLFPPYLTKLSIARFPMLTSVSKVLENLVVLRHLSITNCAKIKVLPSEHLLEKLWHLEIRDCSLLSKRCVKDKGDYWSRIAGIPCIEVD